MGLIRICVWLLAFSFAQAEQKNIDVKWSGVQGDSSCVLTFQGRQILCALGRGGVVSSEDKVEGDGCTPSGSYPLREGYFREDRIGPIQSSIPKFFNVTQTRPNFGWCDEPSDSNYNKFVYLPHNSSYENLWLTDSVVYDLFAVIGYNDNPVTPGKGSAIFFHVTENYGATAGCIAIRLDDLMWVLQNILPSTEIVIS